MSKFIVVGNDVYFEGYKVAVLAERGRDVPETVLSGAREELTRAEKFHEHECPDCGRYEYIRIEE